MFILTSFDVYIKVFDNTGKILENSQGSYLISLETEPTAFCIQGTLSQSTASGVLTFSGIQFNETGSFLIKASGADLISATSSSFPIIKLNLASIIIQLPVITVDFEFQIIVKVKDQFGNPWLSNTEIVLISSIPIEGTTTQSTSTAESTFTLKYSQSGISQLSILAELVTKSTFVKINKQNLEISNSKTGETEPKIIVHELFWVKVRVLDFANTQVLDKDGIALELKVIDNGNTIVSYQNSTISGICEFNGISLANPGVYQVFVGGQESSNVTALLPAVVFGPVTNILIEKPTDLFYTKYLYSFSLSLYNDTGDLIPYNTLVSIYQAEILLTREYSNSGYLKFSMFFNNSGIQSFIASAENIQTQFDCNVNTGNNTDNMCLVSLNESSCLTCENEATEVVNGLCQCVIYSSYNNTSETCECNQGLEASKGFCVTCGNYLLKSEIYAYYSESYKKLIIVFQRKIKYSALDSCEKILSYHSTFLQFLPACSWTDPQQVEISFGLYPDLGIKSIEFNNTLVQASEGKCGYSVDRLIVSIRNIYDLPSISGQINGPEVYSIKCAPGDLILKFSGYSKELSFVWKMITKGSNDLIQYIDSIKDPVLYMPKNLLSVGELNILITVKIEALNIENSFSKSVKIVNEDVLSLDFNIGSYFEMFSHKSITIQVNSLSTCSSEIPNLTWTSADIPNLQELLKASKKSTQLFIPSNTLTPKKYEIQVVADKSTIQTTLSVLSQNLILTLSRSNGIIPLSSWLEISATTSDPDNKAAQFFYEWSCSQDFNPCYNRFGQVINFDNTKNLIKVSNDSLIDGNTYRFQVTVNTESKSITGFVDLTVSSKVHGNVMIPQTDSNILEKEIFKVLPKVDFRGDIKFNWKITGGEFYAKNTELGSPFFCALGNQFQSGSSFKFQLVINDNNVETVIGEFEAKTKSSPDCEEFSIEFVEPYYHLSGKNCWDNDNEDYPLQYQFGSISSNSNLNPFSPLSYNSDYFCFIPAKSEKMFLKVCDSSTSCKLFSSTPKRRLESLNVQYYISQLQYEEKIPNIILVLDGETLTNDEFSELFSAFLTYFEDFSLDQESFSLLTSCLDAVQGFENFNQGYFDDSFEMMNQALEKFSYVLNEDELGILFDLLYINRIYLSQNQFLNVVSALLQISSAGYLPSYRLKYDKYFLAYFHKTYASSLENLYLNLSEFSIKFPENLNINETYTVDLRIVSFDLNESIYFEIQMNKSGTYENYNIEIDSTESISLDLNSPIKVNLSNIFTYNESICQTFNKQNTEKCSIKALSQDKIDLNLYSSGQFSLSNLKSECIYDEFAPITAMSIYCICIIYSISILISSYKNTKPFTFTHPVFTYIPVTSAFTHQNKKNRIISSVQLSSSLICLLFLSKLSKLYIFQSNSVSKYSSQDLLSGFVTFLILQPLTFSSLFIQIRTIKGKHQNMSLIFNIVTCTIAFGALVYFFYANCESSSYNWVLNFIVFGIFEVFFMHSVYAWVIWRCCRKSDKGYTRPVTLGDEPNSRTDALAVISLENIPEEEKTENQQSPKHRTSINLEDMFEKRFSHYARRSSAS